MPKTLLLGTIVIKYNLKITHIIRIFWSTFWALDNGFDLISRGSNESQIRFIEVIIRFCCLDQIINSSTQIFAI